MHAILSFQSNGFRRRTRRDSGNDTGWRSLPNILLESSPDGRWLLETGQGQQVVPRGHLVVIPSSLRHRLVALDVMHTTWALLHWLSGQRSLQIKGDAITLHAGGSYLENLAENLEKPPGLENEIASTRSSLDLLLFLTTSCMIVRSPSDARIEKSLQWIERNLQRPLTRAELARQAGLSETRFHEVFSEAMGASPMDYVNQVRLRKAVGLLAGSREPIAAIAEAAGFSSPYYFSRYFRQKVGQSPREFRNRQSA